MPSVFSPTPQELAVVSQIFSQADPQKTGVLTGDVAVRVFGGAKLPPTTLGTIWNISDEDDKGWLPKKGVAIAVRLIGWAQKGEKITKDLVKKPGPLAVIEGINTVSQQNTGISLPRSPPPTPYPPLTAQDKARFHSMFMKNNPVNSLLSGEKARDIFVKSKLSNEQLMKIWNLADTRDRGALDSTDFAIGMYFIQGVMSNKISFIPTSLPPGLYHQAGGGQDSSGPVKSHISGNSGSFSPVVGSFQQLTGQNQFLQPDITGLSSQLKAPTVPARSFTHSNGYAPAWDVSPTEKASSDRLFDTLDSQKRGYIEGEVAVPFMLDSKLPGEVLAQIWDLSDINSDGHLTRDGFAVAIHLIQQKLAGQDVPSTLPPSLIPPSARISALGTSPFSPASTQSHQEPEPATDLFSFDDTPPSSAFSQQPPNNIGGVLKQTTGSTSNAFASLKTNVDTDPFSSSYQTSPPQDLLSDDDAHGTVSPPLHDQSVEIGNLKNQLQSTKRSLAASREERSALEQTLADQASQLSSLQTQLSSAKAAYETETNLLATFKERHSIQVVDILNTRKELIGAESDLSAIRVEKAEIEGAFLRDKEEARELHKRMVETGKQAEALKADVERIKKEAKQQKGLLAIARKQLSTKESEKAKVEREHAEAVEELSSITHDKDTVDAELAIMTTPVPKVAQRTLSSDSLRFAASQPIPLTPDLSLLPPAKSNNPFERLAMSSPLLQRSSSPFSIQGSAPPSLSSAEPTSLAPGTSNEVSLELPESDLLATSSTFNSFSAVQTPASSKSAQPSGDLQLQLALSPATVNDTDYFVTPPTSVAHDSDASLAHPKERFPSLDKLPDSIPTNEMESLQPKHLSTADVDTSLVAQLKELDIEKLDDSDSDSNDEKPLAVLAANISKQPSKSTPPPQETDTNRFVPASAQTSAFDDIFGPDNADEVQTHLPTTGNPRPSNVSIMPSEHTENTIHTSTQAPNVAGVNEFDETMGKMPASATPANFSFDPGFDDDFDFASASKTPEEPKIEIQDLKKTTQKVEFDDIIKNDDVSKTTGPSTPFYLPPTDKDRTSGTFDAVFAGFESSLDLKVEDKPIVDSPTALSRSDEPSIPGSFPQLPSLTTPPAQSIITSPRPSDIKPTPPRERSPPPLRSPQPRSSSSSSSKDNHDKPKESQSRSKLSIRLFGKRKKQQEPTVPSATQHLTPPIEEPRRMSTPLGDEDVEPVKQITAMGFSRTQAVDALERTGYDVQKALNNLLGAP